MKVLAKDINLLTADKAGPVFTVSSGDGWRQTSPAAGTFVFETYYDLAGLAQDDKTLFFDGALVQDVTNPSQDGGAAGDLVQICDIMSTTPLSDIMLLSFFSLGNNPASRIPSFDQTIYARNRVFVVDLDFAAGGFLNLLSSNQLGSLSPTASDRIYVYRVVALGANNTATSYSILPARYLLQATPKQEPEFQYLMRLMRSYNLQNEPDVD